MILFSTVLFVDGNPVGYNVSEESKNRLLLHPAENTNHEIDPPVVHAKNEKGIWKIEGTQDRDLIDQVLEDISMQMQLPSTLQSAAP